MTISTEDRVDGPYISTGTGPFNITFHVQNTSDVLVVRTSVAGEDSELALTTDYTVSLNSDQDTSPGGTITLVNAQVSGEKTTITSRTTATQSQKIRNLGKFLPAVINDALDKLTILVQELRTSVNRTVRFPVSDDLPSIDLPTAALRANKALVFDGDGNFGVSTEDFDDQGATAAAASAAAAAADAVQTAADRVQTGLDAAEAALQAAKLTGTSTSSLAIGTGSKAFTTQADKSFTPGTWLLITSDADPTDYMHGYVTSYSGTALVVEVTNIGGSGTLADWTIRVSGTRGTTGATGATGAAGAAGPSNYTAPTTTVGANIVLEEGTNNGVNKVTLKAPDSLGADVTVVAPSTAGTLLTDADVKFKLGSFSYNVATASGSQAITGVGFQPDFVEFFGAIGGGSNEMMGHSDGTTEGTIYTQGGGSTTKQVDATKAIVFLTSATDAAQGDVAMTSDGFTITWTKVNSPTGIGTIFYRAFKF